jgi:hypothetical protein
MLYRVARYMPNRLPRSTALYSIEVTSGDADQKSESGAIAIKSSREISLVAI